MPFFSQLYVFTEEVVPSIAAVISTLSVKAEQKCFLLHKHNEALINLGNNKQFKIFAVNQIYISKKQFHQRAFSFFLFLKYRNYKLEYRHIQQPLLHSGLMKKKRGRLRNEMQF